MTTELPLVSVIALCYNHERFVKEAIESVLNQTYPNIELIVVDDASTDNSHKVIEQLAKEYAQIKYMPLERNIGSCAAFNVGYKASKGDFIIDFATDDILLPARIEKGVFALQNAGDDFGVNFSNAHIVDESNSVLKEFYETDNKGKALQPPPEGDIYSMLVKRYFICPPTLFSKREVFEYLGGYNEKLTYEDFDFLVRSSRKYKYCYTDEVLVHRRVLPNSMSTKQYVYKSDQMYSTLDICEKIKEMNVTIDEHKSLRTRIYYEMRQCIRTGNIKLLFKYLNLLFK
ncbi:glycosyltransferase family 2 protein [Fulvivirga lutimaris]|uniref:glycosyltransferase family 2 protein n=1 Tax=Fulvivirga lutimaris TaxID=1819566 RepID=UPI0012BC26B2|nr:glycosyltransferase [Fulvivirga lutimaris]MTI40560.1 glycosyltransferase [Fulvivirga lutimaris]